MPTSGEESKALVPTWGQWETGEYGEGPEFFPHPASDSGRPYLLMTEDDDPELERLFPPTALDVPPVVRAATSITTLADLLRRHRMLLLFFARPQFFVSAGCLGVKTDTLVHGPSFPLWFRAATNYMQSLQVSGHADAVFPLEGELRRFMGEAASIAFPSVDDRGIQRREWTLHPVGSTVMARSAAAIIELVVDLEEVKAVPPSLADQVRALTIPLEIQGKGWQEAKRFRWSYLSAFPPMLWLLEAASGRIGEQGAAPRSAGQVGGRTGRLPAVELLGPDEPPRLYGLLLGAPLSRKRYKLIQAMLAAPADGMTKKEIQEDHPSALEMITKLRMSHPLWEMALLMPEKGGNHYRIADVW